MLARHLERHIPGRPSIIVQNMPGAGTVVAADRRFRHELVVGGIGPSQMPPTMLNTIPGGRSLWFDQRHHPRDRSPRLRTRCLYRKLDSTVMVMKSAEDRHGCDAAYVLDGDGSERLCQETDESSTRYNKRHTSSGSHVSALRPRRQYGRHTRDESIRSIFPRSRSAKAGLGQWACRGCPWNVTDG